jgi:predicted NBD/HSP70 family sugar kinase
MQVYGIDLGGTYLRIAKVDSDTGKISGEIQRFSMRGFRSNEELRRHVFRLIPDRSHVGISSAGVVDEEAMTVRFSANTSITEEISFGRDLRSKKGCRVTQTNDIRAAVQGVARYGEGKGHADVLLATYSSGFNCALTREGKNVTTAEFGHTVYKPDGDLYCGCGGKGHMEIYVSGQGAAAMARQFFWMRQLTRHRILDLALEDLDEEEGPETRSRDDPKTLAWLLHNITAKHVYQAFAEDPHEKPQCDIQAVQVKAIADSFGRMNSIYHPVDIIILMGGQTKSWESLFVPAISLYREDRDNVQLSSLPKPPIVKTAISEIALKGAVGYHMSVLEAAT